MTTTSDSSNQHSATPSGVSSLLPESSVHVNTTAIRAIVLRLSAYTPLTEEEREGIYARQLRRYRTARRILTPTVLLGPMAIAASLVPYVHPLYTLPFPLTAALVIGVGLILGGWIGMAASWFLPNADADLLPISSYWNDQLAMATTRIPELDAIRKAWVRDAKSLSNAEYTLLMDAVRTSERGPIKVV